MKTFLVLVAVFALGACSTSPVRPESAKLVARDRLYITAPPAANDGLVVIVRDTGMVGSGCPMAVYLDGEKAAFLATGEKAEFPAPAGKHMLSAELAGKGLCRMGQSSHANRRSLVFDSVAGRKLDFRVGSDSNGATILYQNSL